LTIACHDQKIARRDARRAQNVKGGNAMNRQTRATAAFALVAATMFGLAGGPGDTRAQAPLFQDLYLPLAWQNASRDDLPIVPTALPPTPTRFVEPPTPTVPPPTDTAPPPTDTPEPAATETPSPEPTPTATPKEPAVTGTIKGKLTKNGEPMPGMGENGPQLELRVRRASGAWEKVASALTDDDGAFAYVNPPALEVGETYQVRWDNPIEEGAGGADGWLGRWFSKPITVFGDGGDVDVGVWEMADLDLSKPCHDCLQTAPITFEWRARSHRRDVYRWALFEGCGRIDRRADAWNSNALARNTSYTTSPPPGFDYDVKYCWYVRIEDATSGWGWPFYDRRVTFCSSAATCRKARTFGQMLRLGAENLTRVGSRNYNGAN